MFGHVCAQIVPSAAFNCSMSIFLILFPLMNIEQNHSCLFTFNIYSILYFSNGIEYIYISLFQLFGRKNYFLKSIYLSFYSLHIFRLEKLIPLIKI